MSTIIMFSKKDSPIILEYVEYFENLFETENVNIQECQLIHKTDYPHELVYYILHNEELTPVIVDEKTIKVYLTKNVIVSIDKETTEKELFVFANNVFVKKEILKMQNNEKKTEMILSNGFLVEITDDTNVDFNVSLSQDIKTNETKEQLILLAQHGLKLLRAKGLQSKNK